MNEQQIVHPEHFITEKAIMPMTHVITILPHIREVPKGDPDYQVPKYKSQKGD